MLKTTSIALAALCIAGMAQAQTGPSGDLSKFGAVRDLAPNAGTFTAAQPSLPGTDTKFSMSAPTAGAAPTAGEPAMTMNASMSAPQGASQLQGLAPQLNDHTFGTKDAGGNASGAAPVQVVPASTGMLGVENSNASGNLSAATFGANNVKLGVK